MGESAIQPLTLLGHLSVFPSLYPLPYLSHTQQELELSQSVNSQDQK